MIERLKLWFRRFSKGECSHCCLFCEYFERCNCDE